MNYLKIALLLFIISCSESNKLDNHIFREGNYWKYVLDSKLKTGDSIELYTKLENRGSDFQGKLINEWVYKESFYSNGIVKTQNGPVSLVQFDKVELETPILSNEFFWIYLPKLQVISSLLPKVSITKRLSFNNNKIMTKNFDVNGNLLNSNLNETKPYNIDYTYKLTLIGKVYYANNLVNDTCDHYQMKFTFKGNDTIFNDINFLYDYYFHDKFGFVYIKIGIGESDYYEMNVKDLKI